MVKYLDYLQNKIIAHRGIFDNQRIYENTEAAFLRAIKKNIPIELDVRMLKDGSIICFHDEDTRRLLHVEGQVENLTYDELAYMSRFQIPLFQDVLKVIAGHVPIIIDIPGNSKKHKLESALALILANYPGVFVIQSFHLRVLKWFYKNYPQWTIGYIIGKRNYQKMIFFNKFSFINIKIGLYDDKFIRRIKEQYFVIGWGVEDRQTYDENHDLFDALVCDNLLDITND